MREALSKRSSQVRLAKKKKKQTKRVNRNLNRLSKIKIAFEIQFQIKIVLLHTYTIADTCCLPPLYLTQSRVIISSLSLIGNEKKNYNISIRSAFSTNSYFVKIVQHRRPSHLYFLFNRKFTRDFVRFRATAQPQTEETSSVYKMRILILSARAGYYSQVFTTDPSPAGRRGRHIIYETSVLYPFM